MAGTFEPAEQSLLSARITETLGWADAGLAVSLAVSGFQKFFVPLTGDPALTERYMADDAAEIGCWAVTEPDHGCDSLGVQRAAIGRRRRRPSQLHRPSRRRRVGDQRLQVGLGVQRHRSPRSPRCSARSTATRASPAAACASSPSTCRACRAASNLDKLGQRALPQGEIHFDDVRVPAANMVVGKELYSMTVGDGARPWPTPSWAPPSSASPARAYELALDYAKDRVQGGRADHRAPERARPALQDVHQGRGGHVPVATRAHLLGNGEPPPVQYSIASKTFCTNTAFEVASEALQIFGGNGLTRSTRSRRSCATPAPR